MKIAKIFLILITVAIISAKAYTEAEKSKIYSKFESLKEKCLKRINNQSNEELTSEAGEIYLDCVFSNGEYLPALDKKILEQLKSISKNLPQVMAFDKALNLNVYWIYVLNRQAKSELDQILNK